MDAGFDRLRIVGGQPALGRSQQSRRRLLDAVRRIAGSPRVRAGVLHASEYFSFGSTTSRCSGKAATTATRSYVFAGDMNGDGGSGNDLIYIPRDASEMNFSAVHAVGGRTLHRGRTGAGVRDLHPAGQVSERAPRRVCQARRRVLPLVQAGRLERDAGSVHQHPRQAQRVPDPGGHPELR